VRGPTVLGSPANTGGGMRGAGLIDLYPIPSKEEDVVSGFIELIPAGEVPPGAMKAVELDGHELLIAHVGDVFLVADARCPHLGGHLVQGVLVGSVVTCPRHHSQFDLTDGHVVRWTDWTGAVLTIGELARHPRPLRVYESEVVEGIVMVGAQKLPIATP